jgi:molecular chaperone GrpE (heat shock protein)
VTIEHDRETGLLDVGSPADGPADAGGVHAAPTGRDDPSQPAKGITGQGEPPSLQEPAEDPAGAANPVAAMDWSQRWDRLDTTIEAMRQTLAASHDRAAARERVIDRLHEENQRLRNGERQLLLRPLLADLQRLRNDLLRQAGGLPSTITAGAVAELLQSFAYSVEQTLERGGVAVIRPRAGEAFDPDSQRAVQVLAAPSPELDSTVADVVADGYHDDVAGRTLLPATVRVYRSQPAG